MKDNAKLKESNMEICCDEKKKGGCWTKIMKEPVVVVQGYIVVEMKLNVGDFFKLKMECFSGKRLA